MNTQNSKNKYFVITGILAAVLVAFVGYYLWQQKQINDIDSFEKCSAAGYPILETYPEQCRTPNGKSFTKVYSDSPITVTGKIECLPHKDKDGPHTLECAYGILQTTTSKHYALSDPDFTKLVSIPMGTAVTITGKFKSDNSSKYDIVGSVTVENIITED